MRDRIERADAIMARFAERTGLTSDRPARRYLWTDAFAVCTFLGLGAVTGGARYDELALRLIERVHGVLGRHRADDARTGWLSGLGPAEGEAHPTRGGLRIGKPLPERASGEPFDERLEWDRDGQYFHYLTKWMHALDQTARAMGRTTFNVWARELAVAAHRGFVYAPPAGGRPRMYWKMSIDLSRPQVASMGQHDPLDGLVTCAALEATAARLAPPDPGPHLGAAMADFAAMLEPSRLATGDPLGLGGLLGDAWRIAELARAGAWPPDDRLWASLLAAAAVGLRHWAHQPDLRTPAGHRLAFRELGLAIGLAAAERLLAEPPREVAAAAEVRAVLEELARYLPLRDAIESFWLADDARRQATWTDHEDINEVMLAAALVPEGFLSARRAE